MIDKLIKSAINRGFMLCVLIYDLGVDYLYPLVTSLTPYRWTDMEDVSQPNDEFLRVIGMAPYRIVRGPDSHILEYVWVPPSWRRKLLMVVVAFALFVDLRWSWTTVEVSRSNLTPVTYTLVKTYRYCFVIFTSIAMCWFVSGRMYQLVELYNRLFHYYRQLDVDFYFRFLVHASLLTPPFCICYAIIDLSLLWLTDGKDLLGMFLFILIRISVLSPWVMLIALQIVVTFALNKRLREYANNAISFADRRNKVPYERSIKCVIETVIKIHSVQWQIARHLSFSIGLIVFFTFIGQFFEYIYFMAILFDNPSVPNIIMFLDVFMLILALIIPCLLAKWQINGVTSRILRELTYRKCDRTVAFLVDKYHVQLMNLPIEYTAFGILKMNFTIVSSILASSMSIFVAVSPTFAEK